MKANPFQPYCYSNIDVNTSLRYKWLFELIDRHKPKRTKKRHRGSPSKLLIIFTNWRQSEGKLPRKVLRNQGSYYYCRKFATDCKTKIELSMRNLSSPRETSRKCSSN